MPRDRSSKETVRLSRGTSRCDIVPALGGSIAAWTVSGQEMMRPASAASLEAGDPFGMASFPLVPYSNRIGDATFEWGGERHVLTRNFLPEPHAIHGVGFECPWQVRTHAGDSMVLVLKHAPGASWPFAFEAEQRVRLGEASLTIEMSAVNLADRPVPLAFGHHPYFPCAGAFLQFRARGVWLTGEDGLPSLRVKPFDKFDYSDPMRVARDDIDHCFVGWDRTARIVWPDRALALEMTASEQLPCTVVCIRSDLDAFCFEPVPHLTDALNRSGNEYRMPVIAPGKSFSATLCFRAVERERTSAGVP